MAVFKASSALARDCATSVTIATISLEMPCLRSASSSMRAAFLFAPKLAPTFPPMMAPKGPSRRPPSTAPPTAPPTDSSTFFFLSPKPMASTRTGPRLVAVVARAPEVTRLLPVTPKVTRLLPVTNEVADVSVDMVGYRRESA